jgi:hypothetical protein
MKIKDLPTGGSCVFGGVGLPVRRAKIGMKTKDLPRGRPVFSGENPGGHSGNPQVHAPDWESKWVSGGLSRVPVA